MPGLKSHIILPNRKPRYKARLNRANPLAGGIQLAYLFNECAGLRTFNSARPYHGTFDLGQGGGPGWTLTPYGPALKGVRNATGVSLASSTKYFISTSYAWSFMVRFLVSQLATVKGEIVILSHATGDAYQVATGTGPLLRLGSATTFYIGSYSIALNTIYTLAVVYQGSSPTAAASFTYYLNGVPITLTDSTITTLGNQNCAFGANNTANYCPAGWMDYLYVWNRMLTQGEVVKLTADPYSIFRPTHTPHEWQDMFTFPSGTGGGFDIDIEVELGGGGSVSGTTVSDLAWGAAWGLPWP